MNVRRWVLGGALVAAVGAGAGAVGWWSLSSWGGREQRVRDDVVVSIPRGTGPAEAAERLAEAGVVDDARRLYWYQRLLRRGQPGLRSGEYRFEAGARVTPEAVLARLGRGESLHPRVTIPEGLRIEEQAELVASTGVATAEEFVRLARDRSVVRALGVEGESLEGYLFPDTYEVTERMGARAVLEMMVRRFDEVWSEVRAQHPALAGLEKREAVTLASIIEKETGRGEERRRISCVFHNRLSKGMRLQTDPTVMYAAFLATGRWDRNIHRSDLQREHPYNTYAVAGLPPGPIASAGASALRAAVDPQSCDDLYFVSRNDGSHEFCPTLACHNENVRRWQVDYFRRKDASR